MSVSFDILKEIAQSVAPRLSGSWKYNALLTEEHSCGWLKLAVVTDNSQPGRAIQFREDMNQRSRVAISGSLPKISGSHVRSSTRITVNPARSGKAIAGDINRRLLPDYLEAWNLRMAEIGNQTEQDEVFLQKIHLLQSFLPDLSPQGRNAVSAQDFRFRLADEIYGKITMGRYYENYRVELTLDFERLVKLAAVIKEL